MSPHELVRLGRLSEAIQVLTLEVRNQPADNRRRTLLFELLCLAGLYDRAEKHLDILARVSQEAELGTLLYRSAIAAERQRQVLFESRQYPRTDDNPGLARPGTLNGRPFSSIEDLDGRIGPRLEMFVAGEYVWLPFEYIGSIQMQPPRFLRDTLWATAVVQGSATAKRKDFGEVLIPVLSPFTWQHTSDTVKLGRETDWRQEGGQSVPFGQKLLVVDGEEIIPMLEIRDLEFTQASCEPGVTSASVEASAQS
jgi:type VI secretion system protein ImpE